MKRRAKRKQEFESIKSDLFEAGVSVLKAAKASEELFDTSVKALAEAVDVDVTDEDDRPVSKGLGTKSIHDLLQAQRHEAELAGDADAYLEISEKIDHLEELEVKRVEREARKLEAQIRIQNAQQQLQQSSSNSIQNAIESEPDADTPQATKVENPPPSAESPIQDELWTERRLREKFKNLDGVRKSLGVEVKTWKDAVIAANQVNTSNGRSSGGS